MSTSSPSVVERAWAAERLQRLARAQGDGLALVHKELGAWHAYRWRPLADEVERLAEGLRRHGLGEGQTLALSGAFQPGLLLLALAGLQCGAHLVTVVPGQGAAALRAWLKVHPVTHAFVGDRRELTAWGLEPGGETAAAGQLFSARPTAQAVPGWQLHSLADLRGPAPVREAPRPRQAALKGLSLLWVQEGTGWEEGLEQVLSRWLGRGDVLALPETPATAARDRSELNPQVLLLSAAERKRLDREFEQRLSVDGWSGRIAQAVLSGQGWIARALRHRIAHLQGLARLESGAPGGEASATGSGGPLSAEPGGVAP